MKKMFAVALLGFAVAACDQQSSTTDTTSSTPAPSAPSSTMPAMKSSSATAPASTQPSAKVTPVNKTCPVGGETVDPAVAVVMHEGKPIGFCCAECIEPFKKDPAKYAAAIK